MRTLITLLCLLPFSALANITVVTSIEPIQQITRAIMQGVGEPELLIKDQASAHHFSFKPSHFTLIKKADLMIWISRNFESGFRRLPNILSKNTRQLELMTALNLKQKDGHIWYSPDLLPQIANQISTVLSDIDPANADRYQSNSQQLIADIEQWAESTRAIIVEAAPRYILDHDFLSHFEQSMGIETAAVLHDGHDQHSSIRELQAIEKALSDSPVKCLLMNEPGASKLARNLAAEFDLEIINILLPSDAGRQPTGFMDSLNRLSSIMQQCR